MLLGATGREEKLHVFLALLEKHFCCCFVLIFFPVILDFTSCETAPCRFKAFIVLEAFLVNGVLNYFVFFRH